MTITLDLPEDLERRLTEEADQLGVPLEQYTVSLLGEVRGTSRKPADGAALVDYWRREGVIGSRPDIEDSQAYAREIRKRAERRGGS